ncbi:SDR family oxidoreductase [Secundilactobacillus hailunensis]|uniref:SDR family oxidoreductase n=1 Tax=Secundilactobacillus hailunensis TaxID=2559923 RepID=A0ABW1T9Z9_9LACO|nr:SDR family oxidoreductase [Secundilactobacillus hailunensis]
MGRLDNKVAIITGGVGGIGLSIAERYVKEGANVVLTANHNVTGGEKAVANFGDDRALFVQQDVAQEADWQKVIAATLSKFGKLDVVVNNAGIAAFNDAEHVTMDEWHKVMAIDLDGEMLGVKYGIQNMKDHGGSIINMSSIEGLIGYPNLFAFTAAKGAVRMMTKSAALYCAQQKYGIRVNSIHPGPIHKPELDDDPKEQALIGEHLKSLPLGRFGEKDEVAGLALYLATDEAAFSTGSEFVIDGGYTAQ